MKAYIIDNIGRLLISRSIDNLQGTEVIGLDLLSPGSYQILVYRNNKLIETEKLNK